VETKFPAIKSVILGCDLHYDDLTAHYFVAGSDVWTLAYEQGLRNGDVLLKIDGKEVTPGNLFGFFLNIAGETLRKFVVRRKEGEVTVPVTIFYLSPDAPHLGFHAERDPKTLKFKITSVYPGSPSEAEGLLPGDFLLQQNDILLNSWKNYYRAILAQKEGAPQTFKIERRDRILEKKIAPVGRPERTQPL
jgi:S1-C subfamily serine protease